jgi:uncharacterized protein (TIGR00297 family)
MMVANDTTILLVLGAVVALLTIGMETLARRGVFPQWLCRKVLHVGAVGACALAPLFLEDLTVLTVVVAASAMLLLVLVGTGMLFREESGRKSWGIALFPLPYLALLLLFPEMSERWLIAIPMMILALSDALAAVVGKLLNTPAYTLTGDPKTIGGSLAFVVSAWMILVLMPSPLSALPALYLQGLALLLAALLAATEALGSKGRDNLYIPSAAAMLLYGAIAGNAFDFLLPSLLALPFAAVFIALTVRKGWLTLGGAVAASLLGVWVIYFQGVLWLLPLLVFFISSTVLGKLLCTRNASSDAKHGSPRDAVQVFANGAIYGLAAALLPTAEAQLIMALSMTVATADTWASEIGMALKGRTYDILGFKRVPIGLSGGISAGGTLGALGGAALLAGVCAMLIRSGTSWPLLVAILAGLGLAGMFIDSILGSLLQAKYAGPAGVLQDRPAQDAAPVSGVVWVSNDAVNLASNVLVAALALGFFS